MDQRASDNRFQTTFCVTSEHPCLPGHFPGQPLVPGVILLEHVANALRDWRNQRIARIGEAKFLAPLRPGETAELELSEKSGHVRFEMRCDGHVIARGVVEGAA
ncbi:hydroxymyristoyl-ACP dehydratase [Dyella sp. 2HG41-7]|uniref:3-hydroxyacyl-ACP dehydratase FabZ family protein n=1 Tax=Dyella sp. 2HG41-7 TaxID=2883239 RepID=UPI001F31F154